MSSQRARSNTPTRRRVDLTALHYDVDQTVKAAEDPQFFPDHEVREKMFTPRINPYRNLHRPENIFESLYVSGLNKQERERSLASANSFREIKKLWDGFSNKPPATGNRPQWNVFASVTSRSSAVRSDESRCLWKKKEEENAKRREDYEAKKKRLARAATPPPLSHTESSLKKTQAKVQIPSFKESSQIMPRRLSTPHTRDQERAIAEREREISARLESMRKSASVRDVVQRLSSRPVIDTKKQANAPSVTQKRPVVRDKPTPFEKQHSTHSSVVLDHTHDSYIEFEEHRKSVAYEVEPVDEPEPTTAVEDSGDRSSAHADLMQSVTYEVEGTPSPKRTSGDSPRSPSPNHAEDPVGASSTEAPAASNDIGNQATTDNRSETKKQPDTDFRRSVDQILIEANMADLSPVQPTAGSAPRRRFKELEVAEE